MSENPDSGRGVNRDDVLSALLAKIRLSGSLQFCFMAAGNWQTDTAPSLASFLSSATHTMQFHIVVSGSCWLKMDGAETALQSSDVLFFPFGSAHQLGAGSGGGTVVPTRELPPKPWRETPVVRYDGHGITVRLLCGYLQCDGVSFAPLRQSLPALIHIRPDNGNEWLDATIRQMVAEIDSPRPGGVSMLPRLTEIVFIEIIRHHIATADTSKPGFLAALRDRALSRCVSLIHDDPERDWSVSELARLSGTSRSVLAGRFQSILGISPIRYVRDWRLYLASVALATTEQPVAAIAGQSGYSDEAAFSRAFSRNYGAPPAAWRASVRA